MPNDGSVPVDSVEELKRKAKRAVPVPSEGDTIDSARSVSESVKSQVSEAGEAYGTVTQSLAEKASGAAEQIRAEL